MDYYAASKLLVKMIDPSLSKQCQSSQSSQLNQTTVISIKNNKSIKLSTIENKAKGC